MSGVNVKAAARLARSGRGSPLWALVLVALLSTGAGAFERAGEVDGVEYRVIAPDWVWVHEKFNVLVILAIAAPVERVEVSLVPPADLFAGGDGTTRTIASRGEHRVAFRGLVAKRIEPAPADTRFEISVTTEGKATPSRRLIEFSIESVRGPIVKRGDSASDDWWSIGAQVGVALLAVPAFLLFLRRFGRKGGWKTVEEARIPEPEERWWSATS